MGKKVIIPGADFSENAIVIPLTIVVKAGGSVTIGSNTYSAGAKDTEFEIDSIPSGFYLNYNNDIKYLRIGTTYQFVDSTGIFRNNENMEEIIFAANVSTGTVYSKVMFANCAKLKKFDGSHFYYLPSDASQLFLGCSAITEIKLPHMGEKSSMAGCFNGCTSLKTVEFGNDFTLTSDADVSTMFYNCPALETIIAPSLVASDYNVTGTPTNVFIQGISSQTGDVTIHCGSGKLTWDHTSQTWIVS